MEHRTNEAVSDLLSELIVDSLGEILKHEDPERFQRWFESEVSRRRALDDDLFMSPAEQVSLANNFARALWNATPLPGNDFRPRTLPAPKRNDLCPCGSGRKFKRCCSSGSPVPGLDSQVIWPLVLRQLSKASLRQAIVTGRAPIDALIGLAWECQEEGRPKVALAYLEPLFDDEIRRGDENHEFALDLVCNSYDELGYSKKKIKLLLHVTRVAKRSPLRSGAWQRLAAISMDQGDVEGAWEQFRAAQRDGPGSASLGVLEVQLLMAERKSAQASERARYWVKRMQRDGWSSDEAPVPFLAAVARDPAQAMAEIGMDMVGGAGRRLWAWLEQVAGRPVPAYSVMHDSPAMSASDDDDPESALRERLSRMGVPGSQVARAIDDLALLEDVPEEEWDDEETRFLVPPASLLKLERAWHEVFPMDKPFSIGLSAEGDDIVWDDSIEDAWMQYLESHSEAFDSLDILDDLANAVLTHEQFSLGAVDEMLLKPILRRAQSIIERSARDEDEVRLAWSYVENRPALRCLVNLLFFEERLGNERVALQLANWLLSLNPNDNHGLRAMVMNDKLRCQDNQAAARLAAQYPNDLSPETMYGGALALFRLGRRDYADAAIRQAIRQLPKVARYLVAKRVRRPKIDAIGVRIGGDDQAWLYREEMRDVWKSTPGALDWLRDASGNPQ